MRNFGLTGQDVGFASSAPGRLRCSAMARRSARFFTGDVRFMKAVRIAMQFSEQWMRATQSSDSRGAASRCDGSRVESVDRWHGVFRLVVGEVTRVANPMPTAEGMRGRSRGGKSFDRVRGPNVAQGSGACALFGRCCRVGRDRCNDLARRSSRRECCVRRARAVSPRIIQAC